eukprot:CAMPEP_0172605792 /NCGR_PEP_ID=MMETSP1068-20121228/26001_1 /TAXON_ID=35684 /ORGANISM="Pseudopedinella elastica, Strain CCMP716" /LENGTH=67 /DNA_ID=CAMNT_0013408289 /DNA_START=207 /DNA_END=407 /DNA_ORIENTATION=+
MAHHARPIPKAAKIKESKSPVPGQPLIDVVERTTFTPALGKHNFALDSFSLRVAQGGPIQPHRRALH